MSFRSNQVSPAYAMTLLAAFVAVCLGVMLALSVHTRTSEDALKTDVGSKSSKRSGDFNTRSTVGADSRETDASVSSDQSGKKAKSEHEAKSSPRKSIAKAELSELDRERSRGEHLSSSESETLREQLIFTARDLAVHSEQPVNALVAVAIIQERFGYVDEARETFEKAIDLTTTFSSVEQAGQDGVAIVKGLVEADFVERAEDYAARIISGRHSSLARNSVAIAQAKQRNMEAAKRVALAATELHLRERTYAQIAAVEAEFATVEAVEATLAAIQNARLKSEGLSKSGQRLAKRGDFSGAERLIRQIHDETQRDIALSSVAETRANKGDMSGGLQLLRRVSDMDRQDRSLRNIATSMMKRSDLTGAKSIALGIENQNVRSSALVTIADRVAQDGDISSALDVTSFIDEPVAKKQALRQISISAVRPAGVIPARRLANRITDRSERARALRGIALATENTGDHHEALRTARTIDSPHEKSLAYASIARRQALRGNDRPAIDLLREAEREARYSGQNNSDQVSESFALAYAETSEPERAFERATQIRNEKQRHRLLAELAGRFAHRDLMHLAEASAGSVQFTPQHQKARQNIVHHVAARTKPSDAFAELGKIQSRQEKVTFLLKVAQKI